MNQSIPRFETKRIALVAAFTAVYAGLRYVPTFPMYGLPGTTFRASDFFAPILGILLGPWLSIPCIIIGTIINYAWAPPIFLGFDFLPACVAAIIAGLMTSGRRSYSIAFYAVILGIFLTLPLSTFWIRLPGGYEVPYAWLHMLVLGFLVLSLGLKTFKWTAYSAGGIPLRGVLLTILSATLAQHLTGGILYELIVFPIHNITTATKASFFWSFIFYLYPTERIVITITSTLVAFPLFRAIRSEGLERLLGPISRRIPSGPLSTFTFLGSAVQRMKKSRLSGA